MIEAIPDTVLMLKNMGLLNRHSKFYPKRIIQKELSTNKSCEKYYPEEFFFNLVASDGLFAI